MDGEEWVLGLEDGGGGEGWGIGELGGVGEGNEKEIEDWRG